MSKKNPSKSSSKPERSNEKKSAVATGSIADRSDHRVPIQLLVDYKSDGHYLFDFCRDLGTGGVFIETKQPLSMGAELELTFTIPDSKETLRTKGKVIWTQGQVSGRDDLNVGMGVQFTQFTDAQRKLLDDFISRYGGRNTGNSSQRRAS